MLFSPQIRLKPLAQFCHRLAMATNAGIQDRKIWTDEAERGSRSERAVAATIRDSLAAGNSITDALRNTGEFYPPLFRQMIEVGEISGRLGEIYKRLARHYDRVLASRRAFMQRLAWPIMQLGMALIVIGVLIWILGMLPANKTSAGVQVDTLGWGLIGTPGLIIYCNILIIIGIACFFLYESLRRSLAWTRRIQQSLVRIPILGGAFKTLALAKFTWALQLVLDTPMDIRKALVLALNATGNDYFARHGADIAQRIERGQSVTQSLAATGVFPSDLLNSIAVGEESGQLVETMQREAVNYEEKSGTALSVIAQFAGYLIWLLVASFIVVMIVRMYMSYIDTIKSFT
ncbi:MAG: type II secretion system F family protein [Bythopirellula sp.]|nr:type II secretion system F family protein [Bythopirellula sp.]